jgi:hypothetical protein
MCGNGKTAEQWVPVKKAIGKKYYGKSATGETLGTNAPTYDGMQIHTVRAFVLFVICAV